MTLAGRLPQLQIEGSVYFGQGVAQAFGTLLGMELALLRRVAMTKLPDSAEYREREVVWTLDPLSAPPHAQGTKPADLPAEQRSWAEGALAPAPPARPLWQRPGGWTRLLDWLDAELDAQHRPRTGELEIIKHSQISLLARVSTVGGQVYLKAVPDFFRLEVPVTCWLSGELVGAAPPALAADAEQGWLLLEDAGETLNLNVVDWNFPNSGRATWTPDDSRALMRHVASIQRASETWLDEVRGLGLPEKGPEYVLGWLPRLLGGEYFQVGQEDGLSAEEAARLRTMQAEVQAALERLRDSPIPLTLGHGDLHEGNVLRRAAQFTLIDWSDACITHPFLDVSPGYLVLPDHAQAAGDAYLEAWAGVLPPAELHALYHAGQRAGELFRALGYIDGILKGVEDASEWGNAYLWHFRELLKGETQT